jgi:CRP-like cAMP-binding protein
VASTILSGSSIVEETALLTLTAARENRVLALLAPTDLEVLLPHLEQRAVRAREVLHKRGRPLDCAFFPLDSVASMVTTALEGQIIEVATIGNEGVVGVFALLGGYSAALEVVMQVPGEVLEMRAVIFQDLAERLPGITRVLHRYIAALFTQVAQGSGCNRIHSVEARTARWLLQAHDRVRGDHFALTHEFLAQMMGVRRASVSEVAGRLHEKRLIKYSRGVVAIEDRKGLERLSCECYGVISGEYERLLGTRTKTVA